MKHTPNLNFARFGVSKPEDWLEDEVEHRREQEDLAMRTVSVQMFHKTVEAVGRYVNHALSILTLETMHCEMLLQQVSPEGREQVSRAFDDMGRELKLVETGLGSVLSFSKLISEKYSKPPEG